MEAGDAAAVFGFHDGTAIEQFIGHRDAGAHQPPGVVAQIEDQALHRRAAVAAGQVLDGFPHQLGHRFTELGDAQVAQLAPALAQTTVAHRQQVHLAPLQPHLPLAWASGLPQRDQHLAARFPPQPGRRGLEAHGDRRPSINAQHLGAGGDARFGGGRSIEGGDHHNALALAGSLTPQRQLQAHPAHGAEGGGAQGSVVGRSQQAGVGVTDRGQHGFDRGVGLLGAFDGPLQRLLA